MLLKHWYRLLGQTWIGFLWRSRTLAQVGGSALRFEFYQVCKEAAKRGAGMVDASHCLGLRQALVG